MTRSGSPCCRAAAAVWLAVSAVAVAPALAAAAEWVVRPVRLGEPSVPTENVDVMVRGDRVTVGYTLGGTDLNVYLSTLASGGSLFSHQTSAGPVLSASFATDVAGNVYYAGGHQSGIRVGTDTDGWGRGVIEGWHPNRALGIRTRLPAMAVDGRGIPALFAMDSSGQRVVSRFDPVTGGWQDQTLPNAVTAATPFAGSLAFMPDSRAVVSFMALNAGGLVSLNVAVQSGNFGWHALGDFGMVSPSRGTSVVALADGGVAVAYTALDGLRVAVYDGTEWSSEVVSAVGSHLLPRSLTVDASGNLAIAYVPRTTNVTAPVHVARRGVDGTWTDQTLPVSGWYGTVAFDAADNPYVGIYNGRDVLLAGTTLPTLPAQDLSFDGTVSAEDVPALAQAVLHPQAFLQSRPDLTTADLVAIADRDGDLRLTTADARLFADSLATSPVPGLPDRYSGYVALDQADLDPAVGSGTGNFFGTVLSTGTPYTIGDSRADVGGPAGVPDGRIDHHEADLLVAAIAPAPPAGAMALADAVPDARLDFNLDGVVDGADLDMLVHDVLGTVEGDADLNGRIDADDFALVDRGYAMQRAGWSAGDFNVDGVVNEADYLLLDSAYATTAGGSVWPASLLASREARFGPDYVMRLMAAVPEPVASMVMPVAAGIACSRHRRRTRQPATAHRA